MLTMVQEEGGIPGGRVPGVVHSKFCWQHPVPLSLVRVDVMPEHVLEGCVGPLGLPISLSVKCAAESLLHLQMLAHSTHKLACESGVTIRDQCLGYTMYAW